MATLVMVGNKETVLEVPQYMQCRCRPLSKLNFTLSFLLLHFALDELDARS